MKNIVICFFSVFALFVANNAYAQAPKTQAQSTDDAAVREIQNKLKQKFQSSQPQQIGKCPQCGTQLELNLPKREFYCPNALCGRVYPKDHNCEKWKCALVQQEPADKNNYFKKLTITNRCVTMNAFRYEIKTSEGSLIDSGKLCYPGIYEKTVPSSCIVYIYTIPDQRFQPCIDDVIKPNK